MLAPFIIFSQTPLLNGPAGELFDGLLGILLAALILYSIVLLRKNKSNLNIGLLFYILNLFLVALGAYYFGDGLELLFGSYILDIFKLGVLVYAIPSYFIMLKYDLKRYINSNKIK